MRKAYGSGKHIDTDQKKTGEISFPRRAGYARAHIMIAIMNIERAIKDRTTENLEKLAETLKTVDEELDGDFNPKIDL